jgi:hypothetical protein
MLATRATMTTLSMVNPAYRSGKNRSL